MLAVVAKNHEIQISSRWLIFALSSCGRVSAISSCVDTPTSARQISFPTTIRFLLIFLWFVNSRATVDKTARTLSKLLTNPATSHPRREIQFSSPPYMEEEYGRLEWMKTSDTKEILLRLIYMTPYVFRWVLQYKEGWKYPRLGAQQHALTSSFPTSSSSTARWE